MTAPASMNVTDRTDATEQEFRDRIQPFEEAATPPEAFRERAAEALFVARGFGRDSWVSGGTAHTDGVRRDCRYLIDRIFDEVGL